MKMVEVLAGQPRRQMRFCPESILAVNESWLRAFRPDSVWRRRGHWLRRAQSGWCGTGSDEGRSRDRSGTKRCRSQRRELRAS